MKALQSILAASDMSPGALLASRRAAQLAARNGASLHLQHVLANGALTRLRELFQGEAPALEQRLGEHAQQQLEQLAQALHAEFSVQARVHVEQGQLVASVAEQAERLQTDLLVIGARGHSRLRDLLVGSTVERLAQRSQRPLLVVRQAVAQPYRRILVPVDFSSRSLAILRLCKRLAGDAQMVLLHVIELPFEGTLRYAGLDDSALAGMRATAEREASLRLRELVTQAGLAAEQSTTLLLHGDASLAILEQQRLLQCDLVALGKRAHGPLTEALLGSVTRHVLAHSECDVLVVEQDD